uniref:DUF3782 domain-containing protein n=1 Tax=Candidatus Kentrum sp. DK TaxID=2126562 RepID=A0A450RTW6_9GAMM|nr:MAG: hypothetical protein BECKDK2373B_GA0170837_10026 [Candidatus Kentron sp. DK]
MSAITYEEVLSLFRETDRGFQEAARLSKETSREIRDLKRTVMEQSRQIKEQGRQLGGIGDKFGYFTEGMALPSMERILTEHFGMTVIMPRVRIRKNGETLEIDVLAYANDDVNLAVVVEVKSRVKPAALDPLRSILTRFRVLYPEHRDKAVIGILAGVDWDRGVAEAAREEGFLTASIRDEIFDLTTPEGFEAKRW